MYFLYNSSQAMPVLHFVVDGMGASENGMLASAYVVLGQNNEYKALSVCWDLSLGWLYGYITMHLGMHRLEHEFKVMGMAPYAHEGHARRIKESAFDKLLTFGEDGVFHAACLTNQGALFHKALSEALAFERFDNIAGAVQLFLEEKLVEWVTYWVKKTGVRKITLSGGVMMNVKAAKKIYEIADVEELFVVPSAGDESTPLGALYYANMRAGVPIKPVTDLYLGRAFSDEYVVNYLETVKDRYSWA
jgi:carbamoyltransferase